MKFCPKCDNYLYLSTRDSQLLRRCETCGYEETDKEGGLVMETIVQERSSEGYKILLNEFTPDDPALPHIDKLPCPRKTCSTNVKGVKRDVIYIKYDTVNLKFLYICKVCGEQWRSRS